MSAHMKMHPTRQGKKTIFLLYLTDGQHQYAIPKHIAEACRVQTTEEKSVSSETVFSELEAKHTKAGALLKGLRTRENLTQAAFAKKIDVSQANLSKMEQGKRIIGKTIAKRIEKAFGVNFRYFID